MTGLKIIGTLLISFVCITNGIYDYSVPKIEGGNQSISAYEGKKILVITLPLVQNASTDSMLFALDTLASAHQNNLAVIAVPSYEDGYSIQQKTALQQWYRSKLGNYILVTDGLYTRKTSGSQQHNLFKWLTHLEQNEIFNLDIEGPGYKFFIRENGELYGILTPQVLISSVAVHKTIQIQ